MIRLCIVIPTRHRPELAMNAIRALLGQRDEGLTVIVSDNSSREEDVQQLRDFCGATHDPRLQYIRPERALDMGAHWDWALSQAMSRTAATHFSVQYDRKVAKRDTVERLVAAATRHPGLLLTAPTDFTIHNGEFFDLVQYPGTDADYEVPTSAVVATSAAGWIDEMGQCWPFLSNCLVPRAIVERIRERFGSICDSITPDSAFGYRFCAVEERYVHCDHALGVLYAFHTSNGQAYYRRDTSGTFGDFLNLVGDRGWLAAAPIPGLTLGLNAVFQEYSLVRREVGDAFPPIDHAGYLRQLATGLRRISNEDERTALRAILVENGWREEREQPVVPAPRPPLTLRWWRALGDLTRPVRRPLGLLRAPAAHLPRLRREDAAVEYLLTHERPPMKGNAALELLQAKRIVR